MFGNIRFRNIWIRANFKSMGLDTGHETVLFGSGFSFVGQLGTWIFLYREMSFGFQFESTASGFWAKDWLRSVFGILDKIV
ncbi:unnamed protein product [Rhizophagus irregularis]|nr:unnamed protein product [Rhizophagus irregularis]